MPTASVPSVVGFRRYFKCCKGYARGDSAGPPFKQRQLKSRARCQGARLYVNRKHYCCMQDSLQGN